MNLKELILKAMSKTPYASSPDTMLVVAKLIDLGYLSTSEISSWLEAPNKRFEGQKPIDLINTGNTYDVYAYLITRSKELTNKASGLNNSNLH